MGLGRRLVACPPVPGSPLLVALDAGTTGVRALAVDATGRVLDVAHRELTQSYPAPGLVEHDPAEILALVDETLGELCARRGRSDTVAAVGITNQRETVVALDRDDGRLLGPAIVWQDRRTAPECAALVMSDGAGAIRDRTGLTIDPYFSATKMRWLLEHRDLGAATKLGLCTVDTLVCWHLTGGVDGGAYVTDHSNASRTLLYNLDEGAWSDELCGVFGVPRGVLATIVPSCGVVGAVRAGSPLAGVPVAGILGDQQAALFGQRCVRPAMVKATYGTGAFVLANAGTSRPAAVDGLVTTVAWDLGDLGPRTFALEGSSFVAGAAIQWLRDELGLIDEALRGRPARCQRRRRRRCALRPCARRAREPVVGSRRAGALVGLSRGVTRAHVARAVVDALSFQGRAMLDAMRSAVALESLRVDGGAAAMDLLCRSLADGTRLAVERPTSVEATAVGAALCAGVAVGACALERLEDGYELDARFEPGDATVLDLDYEAWLDAVGGRCAPSGPPEPSARARYAPATKEDRATTNYEAAVRHTGPRVRRGAAVARLRLWFSDFYRHGIFSLGDDGERREHDGRHAAVGARLARRRHVAVVSMTDCHVLAFGPDGSAAPRQSRAYCGHWANDLVVAGDGTAYVGNFGFDLDGYLAERGASARAEEMPRTNLVVLAPNGGVAQVVPDLRSRTAWC